MLLTNCQCARVKPGESYEAGPTACAAHPKVIKNIRTQLSQGRILSAADARIATIAGMLDIPSVGRTGFNDGTIYPPGEAPGAQMAALAVAGARPAARFALSPPSGDMALHCLVLLVDFPDNVGSEAPSHYENLLFDQTNANSMATFYKESLLRQAHRYRPGHHLDPRRQPVQLLHQR